MPAEHQETQWCQLQWRDNEHDGVSNHRRLDCLLNRLFRRTSKKTSKLRFTCLCERNSLVTGWFPSQRASNAENVSIWWRRHAKVGYRFICGTATWKIRKQFIIASTKLLRKWRECCTLTQGSNQRPFLTYRDHDKYEYGLKFHWIFVPMGLINNIPTLSYLILSYLILWYYLILSYLILSYLILSDLIWSDLILSYGLVCWRIYASLGCNELNTVDISLVKSHTHFE